MGLERQHHAVVLEHGSLFPQGPGRELQQRLGRRAGGAPPHHSPGTGAHYPGPKAGCLHSRVLVGSKDILTLPGSHIEGDVPAAAPLQVEVVLGREHGHVVEICPVHTFSFLFTESRELDSLGPMVQGPAQDIHGGQAQGKEPVAVYTDPHGITFF